MAYGYEAEDMPKERGDAGQYIETVTLDDVLAVFATVDGPPVVTSADVAEATGLSRDSARRKLETLRDRGRVDRRKSAGRVLYWPTDAVEDRPLADGRERAQDTAEGTTEPAAKGEPSGEDGTASAPAQAPDQSDEAPTPTSAADATPPEAARDERPDTLTGAVDWVAEKWEDTDARLEARKAAATAVLEYAREHGGVSKQEAKEDVYPEYPVDGQTPRTWYRKTIRPVLNEVAEYDQSARNYQLILEDT